jgi:hypothetical protein
MDPKLTSVIERVQKLLALSHSSNANEAAAAAAIANKLIDQYRLSEAEISTVSQDDDPFIEDDSYVYETGRITEWKRALVTGISNHYGVACFNDITMASGRKVSRYKLVGRKSDIQIARYMFGWLEMECQRLSDKEAKGRGRIYVASYCMGFVAGVREQLRASRKEAQQGATSMAIVKIDSRYQESRAFMYARRPDIHFSQTYSQTQIDHAGFASGQVRGKNIHLGSALNSGSVKTLKG